MEKELFCCVLDVVGCVLVVLCCCCDHEMFMAKLREFWWCLAESKVDGCRELEGRWCCCWLPCM